MRRLGRWLFYWLPPAAWAAAIFGLSSLSSLPRPPAYPGEDKVLHALFFAILALWLLRALTGERRIRLGKAAALAFLAASLYGAFDEVHQYFVPPRTMDAADWLADSLGAAVVFVVAVVAARVSRAGGEEGPL
ncbi:MAG: VanZ family protein [Verrucomicrobia bacterium]|nr:VanZ family protein [Verrucomicrobiota bacterium]MBU1910052.1 VanZ family protein [Verrucomicrobiota bacterium]